MAHAHRETGHAVASGDLGQQCEMRARLLVGRRDAHEAGDREAEPVAAIGDEGVGALGQHAGLLGLGAGVDLDVERGAASAAGHLGRQGLGDPGAIDRLDHVEQFDGLAGLVGLQRPDEVQHEAVGRGAQSGPLGFCLLDAVLPKDALAGRDHGRDRLGRIGFRHRHQGDARGLAVTIARCPADPQLDVVQPVDAVLRSRLSVVSHGHLLLRAGKESPGRTVASRRASPARAKSAAPLWCRTRLWGRQWPTKTISC